MMTWEIMLGAQLISMLGAIIEYDRENKSDMLYTLKNYLWNDCSLLHAAEAMHMHRNSVKYRINKIEEILGKSIDRADVKLELMNAILCAQICGKN